MHACVTEWAVCLSCSHRPPDPCALGEPPLGLGAGGRWRREPVPCELVLIHQVGMTFPVFSGGLSGRPPGPGTVSGVGAERARAAAAPALWVPLWVPLSVPHCRCGFHGPCRPGPRERCGALSRRRGARALGTRGVKTRETQSPTQVPQRGLGARGVRWELPVDGRIHGISRNWQPTPPMCPDTQAHSRTRMQTCMHTLTGTCA